MALVICADCRNERSDQAPACPHCGRPNPAGYVARADAAPGISPKLFLGILAMLSVAFCTYQVRRTPDGPEVVDAPIATGPTDRDLVSITEQHLKEQMRDPSSVETRNVSVARTSGKPIVCGEVNAKNGFGGYTGFQHFVGVGSAVFVEGQLDQREFVKVWKKMC